MAHSSFINVTNNLSDKIRYKLGIELNVRIIFYLGFKSLWQLHIEGMAMYIEQLL